MKTLKAKLALVAALLSVFAVSIVVSVVDEEGNIRPTVTIRVDGPDRDRKRDDRLVLTPAAQEVRQDAAQGDFSDIEEPMRGPDPAPVGISGPLAAQEWPGCTTRFVAAVSSRRGVVPLAFAVHYTAGWNQVGLADMNGLTAYSNNLRNQVSWHFLIDREGHCYYSVPVNQKAWTIAGLNSETINVEMVGRGTEPDYGGQAGVRKLAQVFARVQHLYPHIKLQLGATDGRCNVTRPGWITHWMGGSCSGGHHDIRPYSLEQLIAKVRRLLQPPLLPCTPLNIERALARRFPELTIRVDGVLGNRSRAGLRRVQRGNYLRVDGIVGPRSGRALGLKGCPA